MLASTNQSSISLLTKNDSKILGKSKLRLKESHNNLETNNMKTLNSTWTPLNDKHTNSNLFIERVDLVSRWFDLWNDKQRKWFLMTILSQCRPRQICFIEEAFNQLGVYERKDFTTILPTNLSKHIFSFLSAQDLARCAQVSSHWKDLSEQDEIWKPKCLRFGWLLPYKPLAREIGAWKAHYVKCVLDLNAKPLNKNDAFKFRESLYKRELSDSEKENFFKMSAKRLNLIEIKSSRKPWMPNSTRPKDLKKNETLLYLPRSSLENKSLRENNLLYTSTIDSNYFTPLEMNNVLKRSKSIHGDMLQSFKNSLPLNLFRIKETYKRMRKSESDLFKTDLTNTSIMNYYTYKNQSFKEDTFAQRNMITSSRSTDNDVKVLFISSKVPCCHMLLQSLKMDVIVIPYEYEYTNLNTLISMLNNVINDRIANSIGFFLHFEKPGQLSFTKDSSVYKVNLDEASASSFFMNIAEKLDPKNGKLDFFVPLGSSVDGLELVEKLHKLYSIQNIRVPTGYMGNYKFVNGKWINSIDSDAESTPTFEYFLDFKLNLWIKYCEILDESHDRIAELVLNGYLNDTNQLLVKKIVGSIIFDSLAKSNLLYDMNIQNDLKNILTKSASSENFFLTLFNELQEKLNVKREAVFEKQSSKSLDSKDETEINQTSQEVSLLNQKPKFNYSNNDYLLRSDMALKAFIKNKSLPEMIEPSIRTEIALEIVKSEMNFMRVLETIQKHYARPLKYSSDSGHVIISQSVIDLLFNELAILYNLSKETVKELNLRVKSWSLLTCVGDVFNKVIENSQCYVNYFNNYDTILTTLDKLLVSNPKFRVYFTQIDTNNAKNTMTLQEMMGSPWPHVKQLINLLSSLQLHTSKEHPDYANIAKSLNKFRELYLFIKQVQIRVENRNKLLEIQRSIINLPEIPTVGSYLILEEKAIILNKISYKFVKDITCFLFNNSLLLAYRIKKHFAFSKYVQESLVYYDLISDIKHMTVDDFIDSYHTLNAIQINTPYNQEYYIQFESNEKKFNFLNQLNSIKQFLA